MVAELSQTNGEGLNSVRCENTRTFQEQKGNIWKTKLMYRGISEFKEDYQPRTNLIKDENDNLLVDSYSTWMYGKMSSIRY
jgi:hypothetical protein